MNFLKNLGFILIKGVGIASGLYPIVKQFIPTGSQATVDKTFNAISSMIVLVETVGQQLTLPGTEKLRISVPLVMNVIQTSELMIGKKIADKQKFAAACSTIAGGMADLLNSLQAE